MTQLVICCSLSVMTCNCPVCCIFSQFQRITYVTYYIIYYIISSIILHYLKYYLLYYVITLYYLLYCYYIILLYCYYINLLYCFYIIWLYCFYIIWLHWVTVLFYHIIILTPVKQWVALLFLRRGTADIKFLLPWFRSKQFTELLLIPSITI